MAKIFFLCHTDIWVPGPHHCYHAAGLQCIMMNIERQRLKQQQNDINIEYLDDLVNIIVLGNKINH